MITTHKNITLCVRLNVKKDRYKYMLILRTLNLLHSSFDQNGKEAAAHRLTSILANFPKAFTEEANCFRS